MFVDVRDLKIGDVFVYETSWRPSADGTYHFRFLKRTRLALDKVEFLAVLDKVIKEDMPVLIEKVDKSYHMAFTANINPDGSWPTFKVLERGKKNVEYCQSCAVPLQWAALAQRCPKCWKVY